jgi:PAS domain S-box-containing protein
MGDDSKRMDEGGSEWSLLDASPDAMLVVSSEGLVVFANKETERLFGHAPDALVGERLEILLPERHRVRHGGHLARFFAQPVGRPMGAGPLLHGLRRDGTEVPVEISLRPVLREDGHVVVAAVRDVTERVRVEQACDLARLEAEAAKANLTAILEAVPDIVLAIDAEGRIEFTNRTLAQHAHEDVIGTHWLAYVPPERRPEMEAALDRALRLAQASSYETSTAGPDGSPILFSSVLAPIRRANGVAGAVIVARDMTEKRQTEAQLLASERMAAIGLLAAGVAHEINNPLVAVIINLDVMTEEVERLRGAKALPAGSDVELLEALRDARHASWRIRQVAQDLTLLARSEDHKVELVDVRKVFDSAIRISRNEIRHRARLVEDFRDVPLVRGNESRLGQVVLNLVVNAAQAIPEGRAEQNEIRVATRMDGQGRAVLEVTDTGAGMSPETIEHLFQPFFTTKAVGVGTGLGLAICQRIVTALDGCIEVESELGRGSLFRVRLPAAPASSLPAPSLTPPPGRVGSPRRARVLVVDDEAAVCSVITSVLASEHDVVVETRARDAMARLEGGETFDLVLCDMMMPDVTGAELYERLEVLRPDLIPRVVLMTGGAFTARAQALLERVASRRLDKPFDAAQLRALVASSLT